MKPRDKLKLIQLRYDAKNPNANGILAGDFDDIDKALADGKKAITQRGRLYRVINDMYKLFTEKDINMGLFLRCLAVGKDSALDRFNSLSSVKIDETEFKVLYDFVRTYEIGVDND